ncbi:MAG: hypothetical protein CMJ59_17260 [Planctomycetaceae bacterium]|nr:hypothetical protein [Planctomycetaceae bacterium]
MASVVVFEDFGWQRLLPLVYFRATFELRCGMATLLDRIDRVAMAKGHALSGVWCRDLLARVFQERGLASVCRPLAPGDLLVNGRGLWNTIPEPNERRGAWVGVSGDPEAVACIGVDEPLSASLTPDVLLDELRLRSHLAGLPRVDVSADVRLFDWPWQVVLDNEQALISDWESRDQTANPATPQADPGVYLLAPESIRIGGQTRIKPCVVIDAEKGPVWIGNNVTILPHSYVQGPAFIGDGSLLQPGAVVHAGTTIGPCCKVGGEIESSIIHGHSNKQHDGFLGHSYIASWVNIAADCINSDLKNTYGSVRVPINGKEVDTNEMFVGMFVGDFSKAGINVSFPTGAVIGFCSSVFAPSSPKFVPSFAWLNRDQVKRLDVRRGMEVATKVMQRRQWTLTAAQADLFGSIRQQALALELQPQLAIESTSPA